MVLAKVLQTITHGNVTYRKDDEVVLSLKAIDGLGAFNFEIIKFLIAPPKNKMIIYPDMCKNICVK